MTNAFRNKVGLSIGALALLVVPAFASAQVVNNTTPVIPTTSSSGLIVSVPTTATTVVGGGANMTLANIRFDATGSFPVTATSVPVFVQYAGGVIPDEITNCRLTNTANGASYTTGTSVLAALLNQENTFRLSSPIVTNTGTPVVLALSCDVASTARGTMQITVNPANFANTSVTSNGSVILPTSGVTAAGTAAPITTVVTFAGSPTVPVTPGLPSTGFGDNAMNIYYALGALLIAVGAGYLLRRNLA